MPKTVIPPVVQDAQYLIMEVDLSSLTMKPAEVSPNPGSDKVQQGEILDMLRKATGDHFILLETVVTQSWGVASFEYEVGAID